MRVAPNSSFKPMLAFAARLNSVLGIGGELWHSEIPYSRAPRARVRCVL